MLLVSILGDFHSSIFPMYNEFKDKLTKHIVVYDDAFSEKNKNHKIIDSLNSFNKIKSLNIDTKEFILDEDSYNSINNLIEYIHTQTDDMQEVYINSTDGLANISFILGSKLLDLGAKVIAYDMYENSYNLISKDEMKAYKITNNLNIKEHFLLKGLEIESAEDVSFANKHSAKIKELFEVYYDEFELMKKDMFRRSIKHRREYQRASQIISLLGLDTVTNYKEITGGLFEYYVYLIVKDLGFDDVAVGVKVNQFFNKNSKISNEFDILMMKDNHLHMIECKFTKNIKMQDLVYKYSSLINLIDDDGKMMILTSHDKYENDIYNVKQESLAHHRRALINKILIRGNIIKSKNAFIEDVNTYFGLLI